MPTPNPEDPRRLTSAPACAKRNLSPGTCLPIHRTKVHGSASCAAHARSHARSSMWRHARSQLGPPACSHLVKGLYRAHLRKNRSLVTTPGYLCRGIRTGPQFSAYSVQSLLPNTVLRLQRRDRPLRRRLQGRMVRTHHQMSRTAPGDFRRQSLSILRFPLAR